VAQFVLKSSPLDHFSMEKQALICLERHQDGSLLYGHDRKPPWFRRVVADVAEF